ncbi:hypothetical protein GCM10010531_16500 [Blastococcus jejuensis]|uniref:Uncharacterized protein n=1 Tax=Blastococcus jejuensis TaxID=351224 RepID=A0ABP6P236_9ACTN
MVGLLLVPVVDGARTHGRRVHRCRADLIVARADPTCDRIGSLTGRASPRPVRCHRILADAADDPSGAT